jgi:Cu/Ag efflux protein CusF
MLARDLQVLLSGTPFGEVAPFATRLKGGFMRKFLALSLVLGLALSAVAVAQDASQSGQQKSQPAQAKSVSGTITQVDNNAKMFVVKDESGQLVTVYWNDATRVTGDLKEGATVSLQTTEQDGKTVATSVQVRTKKSY